MNYGPRRFRGIGTPGVPPQQGGNAVQGQGIWFTYATATLASLAVSTTAGSINIQFDANSVFVWLRSSFTANLTAAGGGGSLTVAASVLPNISVSITDTGKGASFSNTPVPVWTIASPNAGLPYILPVPQLIQANASFAWTFANYDTAQEYYNLQFQLHGYRIFDTTLQSLPQALGAIGNW